MKNFMKENLKPGAISMPIENNILHPLPSINLEDTTPETVA